MSTMLIYRGVPGSGKSTAALEFVRENESYARVNRDEIRFQLFGKWFGVDEVAVTKVQDAQIRAILDSKRDVLIDATNLRARNVKDLMRIAQEFDAEVEFRDFPISFEEAVGRDLWRMSEGKRAVGEAVIKSFFDRFIRNGSELPPTPRLDDVDTRVFRPYVPTVGRHCIIVDIDGTLAHMDGKRGPYDTSMYHIDRFDHDIAGIAWAYRDAFGEDVILLSGRSEDFREATEAWLELNAPYFRYDGLYMRPSRDTRNDAIVKDELFEEHIAGKYTVDFILDDRDRVVKMWRSKGLKCLQVADGNF